MFSRKNGFYIRISFVNKQTCFWLDIVKIEVLYHKTLIRIWKINVLKDINVLQLKNLGIDTYKEAIIFINKNSELCRSEGFEVHARVKVAIKDKYILATLNTIDGDLLGKNQASLSKYAMVTLGAKEGDSLYLSHPKPLQSLSFLRAKVYGNTLNSHQIKAIVNDIVKGLYSKVNLATYLTACAGGNLNQNEVIDLTKAMTEAGTKLSWNKDLVVDKHSVGGLPGNRTSPIIVAIVTAFGLTMPKTSSRAITSPAGTADTMEVLTTVELDVARMQKIVEQEHGCMAWGGSVSLSPADDILIGVERSMDLDSEGQLVASVLSKKISAGSTHIVIDIPVGPTAKVRSFADAEKISSLFKVVANAVGITVTPIITDGMQPVGRGIGPALEAKDILSVLKNERDAPKDLVERSLMLAGKVIEFSSSVKEGEGLAIARKLLEDGSAWRKFKAICNAQGGLKEPCIAKHNHSITALYSGKVCQIDNRQLARFAKLAGAPNDKAAGVVLHTPLGTNVDKGDKLFTIYAETKGELNYSLSLLGEGQAPVQIEASE